MSKYKGSIFTILISSSLGWNMNRLYRKNELNMYGIKNNHDIIVVRQVNIADKQYNSDSNNYSDNNSAESSNSDTLNEKELLKFVEHFSNINKKNKGFCETSIFKNSTFSNSNNEHNNDESFNTYLIIDKWKTKKEFEKSQKEFQTLFSEKNNIYSKKMEDIYFKFEMYDNNYETISSKNIFQKLFYIIF
ncbi:hypothetical protein MKS88_005290 [Plasmodium brasilianum]|uniref:Uncharacterized protein n=2 Tax=Plasmodium (Plasmodium) TaxID=418103 RepID=A0A1A8WE33_PLAMA|nr:conserved Plasmodium protein, unknown function [Plasmodium malariae]KAI4834616.1 hypothetical protein MKS88_005290 [Plasmodium brasilianum]SBS90031.1 hypothetical protein PMALA_028320 [Plasmodium malariae]SCP03156.1 conserved Plasmodium protein, unknown function [Plasmodium malariae]